MQGFVDLAIALTLLLTAATLTALTTVRYFLGNSEFTATAAMVLVFLLLWLTLSGLFARQSWRSWKR